MDITTQSKVKSIIKEHRKEYTFKYDLAQHIIQGFIFGPYGKKKHLKIDEVFDLIDQYDNGGWFKKLLKKIGI